ncbi:dihydrofolate reductase [Permianibacter sp. IMCC34836]|uniref:dihydrofolate reductase family protein n=1 Tax=Permianibacter fluminis TaxID=2738515 RepID=UPI00155253C5|nr:dihydrofolate reductase family protein [Permianibacter fluminis]NQD36697.1 dihydrofolate reductase [Permianibacter fluminis]
MAAPVTLFIAMSLDGFIAGPNDEIDWLFTDQDYGFTPFFDSVDTLIMGRRSYDLSCSFDEWPYPGKRTIVWTREAGKRWDPRVRFATAAPELLIAEAHARGSRGIWLLGGGQLVRAALAAQQIDEIRLAIHPVILGAGIPLFPPGTARTSLQLLQSTAYDSGLLIAHYRVVRPLVAESAH